MSRVGREIIKIPAGVTVDVKECLVTVTGPKGTLAQDIKPQIRINIEGDIIKCERENDEKNVRALHGLYNRLIQNMINGVTVGFTKTLILNGVGYKANMKGEDLVLNLGYSHPNEIKAADGIKFKICNPTEVQALNLGKDGIGVVLQISGTDKQKVGAMANKIRDLRPVEPYHLYGVRYSDEYVARKESKSGKKK